MRKLICAVVLMGLVLMPGHGFAMGADFDFRVAKVQDQIVSEIWYDHHLFWCIAFSPSGAVPVSTNSAKYQTVITPFFHNGFFELHIK